MLPTRGILPLAEKTALEGNSTLRHVKKWCILRVQSAKFTPMATYIKRGSRWKAEICRKGIRKAKSFQTKQEAIAWANLEEADIIAGERGEIPNKSFSDLLDRYAEKVSINKKGHKWELVRINQLKRDRLAQVRLKDLDTTHVSDWRDRRLLDVSGESVRREKNLLAHACQIALDEWKWLKKNPFYKLRMPPKGKPRNRLMTEAERLKLIEVAESDFQKRVIRCMEFALETGMRASELCGLTPDKVVGSVAILEDTKNGERREVPLSAKALDAWGGKPFNLTPRQLDANWRKLTKAAGIEDLHFHDTRSAAATRLSKVLHPLQLARMFGWKDLKQAMTYYRESASDVAKLL